MVKFEVTGKELFDFYFSGPEPWPETARRILAMSLDEVEAEINACDADLPDNVGLLPGEVGAELIQEFARAYLAQREGEK